MFISWSAQIFLAILENQQVRSVSLIVMLKNKQTKKLQTEKIFAVGLTAQALSFMLHYSWLGQIFAVTDPAQNRYAHRTSGERRIPTLHQAATTTAIISQPQYKT